MSQCEFNEDQSFMEYIEAVDAAMIKYFGIDTSEAGIEMDMLADAQEECQTPESFALWYGEKYDLIMRSQK